MNEDFLRGKAAQLEVEKYDRPCKKCGTIISFSKGVADCPRCHGLSNEEQIDLHIQQAQEYEARKRLGLFFAAVFVGLAVVFGYLLL